ncbi:MAG: UDP-N-acetylmuramoyl-tripeptide--D-alanyl-D-alanine ligase [Sedimentisphaerales bacterium]|jgi:UDP-N-acetylmuramoyl-tripeptide--D-alanyl-D-alanine ligase
MKKLLITDLAKILNARVITVSGAVRSTQYTVQKFASVSTDSRTTQPGDCFFAISGEKFDGHNFLADAFAKGATSAVVSQDILPDKFPDKIILKVPDTVKSLGDLASWYRKNCDFKVVAITGSVGKTTTRQIVYHVLSRRFRTHQPTRNFNNFIGLPLSILAAPPDCQILVLELATNHPGEIAYLSKIASPDIALVTNVHPAHLEGFGTTEKIAEEKLSIAADLRPRGTLIINADCQPLLDSARRAKLTFKTFSCFTDADYHTNNIIVGPFASTFTVGNVIVKLPLPGRGNVENAVAAWSICSSLGVSAGDFADAVKTISPVSMRSELLQIGGLTVINDCYNANPASMKNALEILTRLANHQKRRAVFICGDMAELGESAQTLHRRLGDQIASAGVRLLITVGKLAGCAGDAAKNADAGLQMNRFANQAELCDNLHLLIKDSDIILVKGSRINKLESVVGKLKELFGESRQAGTHRSRKTEIK